jgi:hypothetical protein
MVAVKVTVAPEADGFGEAVSVVVVVVLVRAVIVSVTALDVEVAKPALPEYTAVRLSAPAGRAAVENVATPEEFTLPLPRSVPP